MTERIESHNKRSKFSKTYMSISELSEIAEARNGVFERNARSYELEKMDIKLKDLQHYSKEDVEELRRLNKNNIRYKLYFSWLPDHLPKVIVVLGALSLYTFWYGFPALIAFLPITLIMIILMIFIRLTRGY